MARVARLFAAILLAAAASSAPDVSADSLDTKRRVKEQRAAAEARRRAAAEQPERCRDFLTGLSGVLFGGDPACAHDPDGGTVPKPFGRRDDAPRSPEER